MNLEQSKPRHTWQIANDICDQIRGFAWKFVGDLIPLTPLNRKRLVKS